RRCPGTRRSGSLSLAGEPLEGRPDLRQRGEQDSERVWRAVPDGLLDFSPHEKTNPIRAILVHQLPSERRFFAPFVGSQDPPVEELLPPGDRPTVSAYLSLLVAGEPALLRRLAAPADLGVLAAGAAHLPPPNAAAVVAARGRARAGPGDLRPLRRR